MITEDTSTAAGIAQMIVNLGGQVDRCLAIIAARQGYIVPPSQIGPLPLPTTSITHRSNTQKLITECIININS